MVDCTGLENQQAVTRLKGSNPLASAKNLINMENKKQLKAQLTNEISKRYQNRIKELEDSRNALRTKIEIERQQFRELQEKYLNLAQEFESLKDWNIRLMEFMDMSPEEFKKYIVELKTEHMLNSILSKYLPFFNI